MFSYFQWLNRVKYISNIKKKYINLTTPNKMQPSTNLTKTRFFMNAVYTVLKKSEIQMSQWF